MLLFNQILPFLMILEGSLFIYLFFSLKTHQIVNKAQLPSLVIRTFIHLQGNSFGLWSGEVGSDSGSVDNKLCGFKKAK